MNTVYIRKEPPNYSISSTRNATILGFAYDRFLSYTIMMIFVGTVALLIIMHWVNVADARREANQAKRQMEAIKQRLKEKQQQSTSASDEKFFDCIFEAQCQQYFRRRFRSMITLLQEFRLWFCMIVIIVDFEYPSFDKMNKGRPIKAPIKQKNLNIKFAESMWTS